MIGTPDGQRRIGLVLKRTYLFQDGGGCDAAEEERQEAISFGEVPYEELVPPRISPVCRDCDVLAFRRKTDLVVQANAYTYFSGVSMTHVSVRLGGFERSIRVYGDRALLRGIDGALRFSDPEPFDALPLRYDRAYGGVDAVALRRNPAPKMLQELAEIRPEVPIETDTPFHYTRNPCGRGFVIEEDEESLATVQVPNFEFPFDPITPDRLVVRSADGWVNAPLPASMDWQSAEWFPRIAYLGAAWFPDGYRGPVRETTLGWAAPDLVDIQPAIAHFEDPMRIEFTQAASAGMSLDSVRPGELVELRNLHPIYPFCTFRLPEETPQVRMEITPGSWTDLEPHLNSLVIRPENDEVVVTWCASAPLPRMFQPDDVDELRRDIHWSVL